MSSEKNNIKLTRKYNNSLRIRSMTICSILLSFYCIFSFFCNSYFPIPFLGSFLNLDISLVFLIPIVFICKKEWWISSAIISGLFNFLWSGIGGWVGAIFNILVNIFTLTSFWIVKILIFKKDGKEVKYLKTKILLSLFVCLILITLFNCIINGFIFTPLYWWTFSIINQPSFILAQQAYESDESMKVWLLFFDNYWDGIFALYSAFNFLKFGVVFVILFPVIIILYNSKIIQEYLPQE